MKRPEWLKLSAKGPELKMPELKAPTFLVDLWWDLWDRRLLPLVALIVVAIAAVPFLMGGSKPVPPESSLAALAAAGGPPTAEEGAAKLAVVQAEPGLRDYRKRLRRLTPTDPFKQRFTATSLPKSAKLNSATETTTSTGSAGGGGEPSSSSGSTGSEPVTSPPPLGGEPGGAPSSGGGKPHMTIFAFAIDVKITRSGGRQAEAEGGEAKSTHWIKKRVLPFTSLPGEKAPVVTYMGPSTKRKPMFLVSTGVRSVFGEGKCVAGDEACQLLEVEPGFPETFVYGSNEVHYTINVLKLEAVVVGHSQNFSK